MTSTVSDNITAIEAAMEGVTPEEIAAAWATWKSRHGEKLGPGPAFREAIEAAFAVRRPFVEALARQAEALERENAEKDARIAALEAGLKPFARIADMTRRNASGAPVTVNVDRCRDARALLGGSENAE